MLPELAPFVSGTKVAANAQLAFAARDAQDAPDGRYCRGKFVTRVSVFAVKLVTVNVRVGPAALVPAGPKGASEGVMVRPAFVVQPKLRRRRVNP
jgi:hypothetical protein